MKAPKKPGWWDEFVAFAIKGNAMALAVGTIIGAAFSGITKSLTDDVIMPIVSIFTGSIDFSSWKIALPSLFGEKLDPETGAVVVNYLRFGDFLSAVISFLILAVVIFLMVKGVNKLRQLGKKPEEPAPEAPAEPSAEEKLLTEIRDLLKDKQ